MRLRARRRSLVWRPSGGPVGWHGAPGLARPARTGTIRRFIRISALLTMIGLMRLARGVRPRWQPLLAGTVLAVAGFMSCSGAWGALFPAGFWFYVYALLIPSSPDVDQRCRVQVITEPCHGYGRLSWPPDSGAILTSAPAS